MPAFKGAMLLGCTKMGLSQKSVLNRAAGFDLSCRSSPLCEPLDSPLCSHLCGFPGLSRSVKEEKSALSTLIF